MTPKDIYPASSSSPSHHDEPLIMNSLARCYTHREGKNIFSRNWPQLGCQFSFPLPLSHPPDDRSFLCLVSSRRRGLFVYLFVRTYLILKHCEFSSFLFFLACLPASPFISFSLPLTEHRLTN